MTMRLVLEPKAQKTAIVGLTLVGLGSALELS